MKKFALIALMMCFVLSFSFAQDVETNLEVTVEGDATIKAGYNLEAEVFGIQNSASASIKLEYVPEASLESGALEGPYGWITIKDFKITAEGDLTASAPLEASVDAVEAKLLFDPLWIGVYDDDFQNAEAGEFSMPNLSDGNFLTTPLPDASTSIATTGYVVFGYDTDMVDFDITVGSNGGYCDTLNTEDQWALEANTEIAPIPALVLKGNVATGFNYATQPLGFGVQAEYTYALNDTISIVPTVGFDGAIADLENDSELDWSVGGGVFAKWGSEDEYNAYNASGTSGCDIDWAEVEYQGGAGLAVSIDDESRVDLIVQAVEQRGDDGLLPGLGAAVSFEMTDVTEDTRDMAVGAFLNYNVDGIIPYVRTKYVDSAETLALGLGVEVADIIPNTTFLADYNSINLNDAATAQDLGVFELGLKVAF